MPPSNKSIRIEACFDDLTLLEEALSPPFAAESVDAIVINEGITLKPLFLSVRASRVVGSAEALAFLATVSSAVAAKTLAEMLFKWFMKTKATRVRIERTEVLITRPDEVIRVIREVLEKDDS